MTMTAVFVCYPICSTCKKAEAWLKEHGIVCTVRNIKEERPSEEEIVLWQERSGLPLKRFFNTSGQLYRQLNVKDRLADMDRAEQLKLLGSDGMLVKRPILLCGDRVLVGFREKEWEELLR